MYHISISCRQVLCNNGKTVHKTTTGVHMSSSYSSKFAFVLRSADLQMVFSFQFSQFFAYPPSLSHMSHFFSLYQPSIFFNADIKTCIATLILLLYIPAGIVGSYVYVCGGPIVMHTGGKERVGHSTLHPSLISPTPHTPSPLHPSSISPTPHTPSLPPSFFNIPHPAHPLPPSILL